VREIRQEILQRRSVVSVTVRPYEDLKIPIERHTHRIQELAPSLIGMTANAFSSARRLASCWR
jgi:hypothetical protein